MAKIPVAGRVKTRLAKEIGVARAVALARMAGCASIRRLARDPRWKTVVAVSPDVALDSPLWPAGVRRIPQGRGDLGVRMQRIFDRLPAGPVIIVGTDIPRIATGHVAHAFRLLGRSDAVLGPAGDGGYWLIGLKRRPRIVGPFDNVRWSSRHALGDTLANLEGHRIALADTLDDIDDAAGLERSARFIGRVVHPA